MFSVPWRTPDLYPLWPRQRDRRRSLLAEPPARWCGDTHRAAMAARLLRRLLPILLIEAGHGWTLAPSTRPPTPSLLAARVSAATMNAAEEAKIRESLGGEMASERHRAAPVEVGAEAEAAARQASFEEAQALGTQLATLLAESCAEGEPMPAEAVKVLRALISSTSGARGWFVTLLTDERFDPVFRPPLDAALLSAISDNPEPNIKLMTMNVAMSTATELVHAANGGPRPSPPAHSRPST